MHNILYIPHKNIVYIPHIIGFYGSVCVCKYACARACAFVRMSVSVCILHDVLCIMSYTPHAPA